MSLPEGTKVTNHLKTTSTPSGAEKKSKPDDSCKKISDLLETIRKEFHLGVGDYIQLQEVQVGDTGGWESLFTVYPKSRTGVSNEIQKKLAGILNGVEEPKAKQRITIFAFSVPFVSEPSAEPEETEVSASSD